MGETGRVEIRNQIKLSYLRSIHPQRYKYIYKRCSINLFKFLLNGFLQVK